MLEYTYRWEKGKTHFVFIEFKIDAIREDELTIQLPSWRPGRYELGNFAKNIVEWKIEDEKGKIRSSKKITKDSWKIDTKGANQICINYSFYADKITAGDSFSDENMLYVNPVNCSLYLPDRMEDAVKINLDIPDAFSVATGLKKIAKNQYSAQNFDELADCPFICAENIQSHDFKLNEVDYHIHFCGEVHPNFEKVEQDFRKFLTVQHKSFNDVFPMKAYHFIYLIVPFKAYHGVEHHNSTIILLGPSYDLMDAKNGIYDEFLGVSSHEHYHTWNVKQIRPIEMGPYKFDRENYSRLGYLDEGATTLYGDLYLIRSGVFNFEQWAKTFDNLLSRHFSNYGRFNLSVADSSWDTWLDGYVLGAPNRKTSIYTEGALCTFMLDYLIRKNTSDKCSFDDVMRSFYFDFARKGKGISEADYQLTTEKVAGKSLKNFFDDYINGTEDYEPLLKESLEYYGLNLLSEPAENKNEAYWGIRTLNNQQNETQVLTLAPNSPAQKAGIAVGDIVLSINKIPINQDLHKWAAYFDDDKKATLTVKSKSGLVKNIDIKWTNTIFYKKYHIEKSENTSAEQQQHFKNLIWKD